jgi:hypothetical protein
MADTRVQLEVEDWVRREWMSKKFGQQFTRERIALSPGGRFDCDAVSLDQKIAAAISTSGATTSSGKYAVGKMLKIRSDMFFLLLADAERRIIVLTEKDMYEQCLKELRDGRVPPLIEFHHAQIPDEFDARLRSSRGVASREVTPER